MKIPDADNQDDFELEIRPRDTAAVSIKIPKDVLNTLKRVAASRDMSYQALLKLYIGQGLRQDVARLFDDQLLKATESVLANRFDSKEEVASIIREIRREAL